MQIFEFHKKIIKKMPLATGSEPVVGGGGGGGEGGGGYIFL